MDLDGYAVGGLAVGETHEEMYRVLEAVVPHLPEDKPTYLMGVGTPANILEAWISLTVYIRAGTGGMGMHIPARASLICLTKSMKGMRGQSKRDAAARRAKGTAGRISGIC